jgi:hypothetical protein
MLVSVADAMTAMPSVAFAFAACRALNQVVGFSDLECHSAALSAAVRESP